MAEEASGDSRYEYDPDNSGYYPYGVVATSALAQPPYSYMHSEQYATPQHHGTESSRPLLFSHQLQRYPEWDDPNAYLVGASVPNHEFNPAPPAPQPPLGPPFGARHQHGRRQPGGYTWFDSASNDPSGTSFASDDGRRVAMAPPFNVDQYPESLLTQSGAIGAPSGAYGRGNHPSVDPLMWMQPDPRAPAPTPSSQLPTMPSTAHHNPAYAATGITDLSAVYGPGAADRTHQMSRSAQHAKVGSIIEPTAWNTPQGPAVPGVALSRQSPSVPTSRPQAFPSVPADATNLAALPPAFEQRAQIHMADSYSHMATQSPRDHGNVSVQGTYDAALAGLEGLPSSGPVRKSESSSKKHHHRKVAEPYRLVPRSAPPARGSQSKNKDSKHDKSKKSVKLHPERIASHMSGAYSGSSAVAAVSSALENMSLASDQPGGFGSGAGEAPWQGPVASPTFPEAATRDDWETKARDLCSEVWRRKISASMVVQHESFMLGRTANEVELHFQNECRNAWAEVNTLASRYQEGGGSVQNMVVRPSAESNLLQPADTTVTTYRARYYCTLEEANEPHNPAKSLWKGTASLKSQLPERSKGGKAKYGREMNRRSREKRRAGG